ncbi:MAG: hypothetical protein ABMB14_23775 [Myxococcota bacterium]
MTWIGLWLAAGTAEAKPTKCWVPTRMRYSGRDTLAYTPLTDAQKRELEVARVEQREPREIRAGWLTLEINRLTLDAADPANQLILVRKDGVEVARVEPPSAVPDINPEVFQYWFSYAVVQLPEGIAPPLDVTVVDRLHNSACTWSVDPTGLATLQPRDKKADAALVTELTPPAPAP